MKKYLGLFALVAFAMEAVNAEEIDLFADVQGIELNDDELIVVQGDGLGAALLGAFSGAVVGAMVEAGDMCIKAVFRKETRNSKQMADSIGEAATKGAVGGFFVGLFTPAL